MNATELKLELIKKIIDSSDIIFLLKIDALLKEKNNVASEENLSVNEPVLKYESVRIFSAEEQRRINRALEQYENGECISDEEAQNELEKWFEDQEERQIYHFTEEQLLSINESIEQYKNGNFLTEEEAEEDIQKWFIEQDEE